ncbi:MAG: hypothetical protein KIS92_00285 [Planctomycetota bacterium]|nr:hypothetical protein [Planctomycetota bacterium]
MRTRVTGTAAAACALLLAGCGGGYKAPGPAPERAPQPAPTEKTVAPEGNPKTEEKSPEAKSDAKTDAPKADAGSVDVEFGKKVLFTARMPKAWQSEEPENKMRTYQARVPKQGEDKEDAQLQIFKMSGAGTAEETLKRWQNSQWGGADAMEERRELKTKLGAEATVAVFSGTYTAMDFSPDKKEPREHFMMLGAIVPTDEGTFYIKLVGPRETIDAQRDAFEEMITSFDLKK